MNNKSKQIEAIFWLIGAVIWVIPAQADAASGSPKSEKEKETPRFLARDKGEQGVRDRKTFRPDIFSSATPAPLPAPVKVSQSIGSSVKVTAVQLNKTDSGLMVILKTLDGASATAFETTYNETYVADLISSKLQLPDGKEFRVDHPAPGIASVRVTQLYENTVRVKVVGDGALPTGRVVTQSGGISVSLTPGVPTAQKPAPTPAVTPLPGTTQPSPTPSESPTPTPPEENQPPPPKPETTPTAPGTGQNPSTPNNPSQINVEVIGKPDTGYRVPDTTTGTRTNTPIRDVPQTVQVIPRQVIEDQGDIRLGDALRNLGIGADNAPARDTDNVLIRGFELLGQNALKNGVRDQTIGTAYASDLANVERIEVLKGPASVLYGTLAPGGVFNLVTKQPLSEPYYSVGGKVGSRSLYETSIDFSGPLTTDKKLLYRLNADYENSAGYLQYQFDERIFVAPVISWQLSRDTKLTIEGEYLSTRRRDLFADSLPAKGTLLPNPFGKIPLDRYLGEPTIDSARQTEGRIGYNFEHRFSDNWTLYNTARYAFNQIFATSTSAGGLGADNRTARRTLYVFKPSTIGTYAEDTHVVGKFKTFGVEHQLLVGVDGYDNITAPYGAAVFSFPSIDVYNPVYGEQPGRAAGSFSSKTVIKQLGVYFQDQLALLPNLKLVLGGREDFEETRSLNFSPTSATTGSDNSQFAFSPRAGIVYQPIQPISLYASYSRSFQAGYGTDFFGKPFSPTYGTQYEVGVKTDLLNNKLSATLSLYDLTQTNIGTADLDHPGFVVQIGEARSRGVELYVTGELAPGWNIIGSYNYTDPRITRDNSIKVGTVLPNAPFNSASLWTTYIIPKGQLKGFGGGVGVFYVGSRFGDTGNTLNLPSYVRTDAAIYYRQNKFQLGLNFRNLFDVLYFDAGSRNVYRGEPFGVELNFKFRF